MSRHSDLDSRCAVCSWTIVDESHEAIDVHGDVVLVCSTDCLAAGTRSGSITPMED